MTTSTTRDPVAYKSMREYMMILEERGLLKRVTAPVNLDYEVGTISYRDLTRTGPGLLFGVEPQADSLPAGQLGPGRSGGEHLVGITLRAPGGSFLESTRPDPLVDGPSGHVGVAVEVGFGQVTEGDAAVKSHVDEGTFETPLVAQPVPAGIHRVASAVPHPARPRIQLPLRFRQRPGQGRAVGIFSSSGAVEHGSPPQGL